MATKKFKFRAAYACDGKGCPTNGKRARWAEAGVRGFLKATKEPEIVEEDAIGDLITDLLHLCDREGVDGAELVGRAVRNWEAER